MEACMFRTAERLLMTSWNVARLSSSAAIDFSRVCRRQRLPVVLLALLQRLVERGAVATQQTSGNTPSPSSTHKCGTTPGAWIIGKGVGLEILFDAVRKWKPVDAVDARAVDDGVSAGFVQGWNWKVRNYVTLRKLVLDINGITFTWLWDTDLLRKKLFHSYTVKPVYNHHPWDLKIVGVVDRW